MYMPMPYTLLPVAVQPLPGVQPMPPALRLPWMSTVETGAVTPLLSLKTIPPVACRLSDRFFTPSSDSLLPALQTMLRSARSVSVVLAVALVTAMLSAT